MSYAIRNRTPFAAEATFATDEEAWPVLVPVLKATYSIGKDGMLSLADPQWPVNLAGERTDPGAQYSSWRFEPEAGLPKIATDVVLVGVARPTRGIARECVVSLRVGTLEKSVLVTGERTWVKRFGGRISPTEAEPFEEMPLTWERSFGGCAPEGRDAHRRAREERNPVGIAFDQTCSGFSEGLRLPNLEDQRQRLARFGDTVAPAGFGFISSDWQPRISYAGTYDATWFRDRMPRLPLDFDRRFHNGAPSGLIAKGHLKGNEDVVATNVGPHGSLAFRLPRVPAPQCTVRLLGARAATCEMHLDTVVIASEETVVVLIWRPAHLVRSEPQQVRSIRFEVEGVPIHAR